MSDRISVIIPVYNDSARILKAIDSLKNQLSNSFEVIIIDDGSTDDTFKVVKEYIRNENNFKLFKKENGGPASARNYGLSKVTCKYVSFVDSDDILDESYVLNFLKIMDDYNYDMICFSHENIFKNRKLRKKSFNYSGEIRGFLCNIMSYLMSETLQAPWAKLFKTSIIRENNIIFPEEFLFGEDTHFVYSYLKCINTIRVSDYVGYYHNKYMGTLSNRYVENICDMYLSLYKILREILIFYDIENYKELISVPFQKDILYGLSILNNVKYRINRINLKSQIEKIIHADISDDLFVYNKHTSYTYNLLCESYKRKNFSLLNFYFRFKSLIKIILKR